MLVAVFEVIAEHFLNILRCQQIVSLRGGDVYQCHARLDAVFQVDVTVEVGGGPKVDELNAVIDATDAVNPSKPLNNAHRIPVNVIVNQVITVLEVLAFRNAIRANQQVNFAILR